MERPSSVAPSTHFQSLKKIAVLGNYSPRRCGIATFTTHLVEALAEQYPLAEVDAIVVSDLPDYDYPAKVKFQIPEQDIEAYRQAAKFINEGGYDVLSVQHEFGIFGGSAGSHLLALLREVKMPIVTTLHTVLREPDGAQRQVMDELVQLSERIVVMSQTGAGFLEEIYGVPPSRIDLIHHGIPNFGNSESNTIRQQLGIEGPMILTFGLLSPDKGIQYMLEAMRSIVAQFPKAAYVVLGATHPKIRAGTAGESYRDSLLGLAESEGIADNVRFVDQFVSQTELISYIEASDIYVTPYLNPKQITSGTLAYAVGAGKAVISTPYWYAEELLAEGRGILVPFRDSESIAGAVLGVMQDPVTCREMRGRAKDFGQQMRWPEVGIRYVESFTLALEENSGDVQKLLGVGSHPHKGQMPVLKLDRLFAMTDDTGLIQHSTHDIPNRDEGYCVDDNARALLLVARLMSDRVHEVGPLYRNYLSFIQHAFNPETGRFRNFMSYGREWLEASGSDDSHCRTLWALGSVVAHGPAGGGKVVAKALFNQGLAAVESIGSPRSWAFAILATEEYLIGEPGDPAATGLRARMASRLLTCYDIVHHPGWRWFEEGLNYDNARLSQALLLAGHSLNNSRMTAAGLESLRWLMDEQKGPKGEFAGIGTGGYRLGDVQRPYFDQQPLEAWASISACLYAARITGESSWLAEARSAFAWFLGENMIGLPVYDAGTGGCRDGLHADRPNENQGAESTLSFLCALQEMRQAETSNLSLQPKADLR